MTPFLADHGHGPAEPATPWMWAVWAFAVVASVWSIWTAVRQTLHPGETEPDHVKRSILDDDAVPARPPGPGAPPA